MTKTASTSIETAIEPYCGVHFNGPPSAVKHLSAQVYQDHIAPVFAETVPEFPIQSFCLIREPLDWLESWYRYRTRKALLNPDHHGHNKYTGDITYGEFVERFLSNEETGENKIYLTTPYEFCADRRGGVGLDLIFPYDDMAAVSRFLTEKIGEEITIPRKNVSPKKQVELEPELEATLRERLRKDLALYEFIVARGRYEASRDSEALKAELRRAG